MNTDQKLLGIGVAILATLLIAELFNGVMFFAQHINCRCTPGPPGFDAMIFGMTFIFGFFIALICLVSIGIPFHLFLQNNQYDSWVAYLIAGLVSGAAVGTVMVWLLSSFTFAGFGFLCFISFHSLLAASVASVTFWYVVVRPHRYLL